MDLFGRVQNGRQVESQIVRWRDSEARAERDIVSVEEPLEVRIEGNSVAVIMRTPGDDFELSAGFLLSEGILDGADAIGSISYCPNADPPNEKNVVEVKLAAGHAFDSSQLKRNFYASSSCGVCGKASIEAITAGRMIVAHHFTIDGHDLCAWPEAMRHAQAVFEQTGSLHAAALFAHDNTLLGIHEDVGRHNAVDKIVGSFALKGEPIPEACGLMVSGRTSFEIVQKALVAGIAFVAAVSAPSSLAVELARAGGMTLVGFLRGKGFNVYAGGERIRGDVPIIGE
ncbi:MAG: formate dehydrogenase accessory sulfurtransferase FdhD [Candidatus Latescibacterota bacterium]